MCAIYISCCPPPILPFYVLFLSLDYLSSHIRSSSNRPSHSSSFFFHSFVMAPSLLGRASLLLLLGLRAVSADQVCTPQSSTPDGLFCGVVGFVNDFGFSITELSDPEYLTLQGCAAACAATLNCLSFVLSESVICRIESITASQLLLSPDAGNNDESYDIDCFVCVDAPTVTSTTSSPSTTPSTDPSTPDSICTQQIGRASCRERVS